MKWWAPQATSACQSNRYSRVFGLWAAWASAMRMAGTTNIRSLSMAAAISWGSASGRLERYTSSTAEPSLPAMPNTASTVMATSSSLKMSLRSTMKIRASSLVVPIMRSVSAAAPATMASMGRWGRASVPYVGWNAMADAAASPKRAGSRVV